MPDAILPAVAALRLLDHHCHGVVPRDLDATGLEVLLTEADSAHPLGGAGGLLDSQVGFALRRWCAPVLDLPRHAPAAEYLARRAELGHAEVTGRMLRAAGLGGVCVDTGYTPEPLLSPAEVGRAAGVPGYEIVRLERVAEEVAASGVPAAGLADGVRDALSRRAAAPGVVGAKSIAAYRVGLALAPHRPEPREVTTAAGRWLASLRPGVPPRLADETLHRFLAYTALDLGLPVQFHTGYGDRDVHLARADPVLLTDFLRATAPLGVPVILLHTYPYHRAAGYLAQVFPHVFLDVSLATHNAGHRAVAILDEALELAPFGKVLYASDAYGLPELYLLGAVLFRVALSAHLRSALDRDAWSSADAERVAHLIGEDNARRVYRLPP